MPKLNYKNAKTNLIALYKTPSGAEVATHISPWYEMYMVAFVEILEGNGCVSSDDFSSLLARMNQFDDVGEFLTIDTDQQLLEIAAFGLILVDRLNDQKPDAVNLNWFFAQHEALVECYGYVIEFVELDGSLRRRKRARAMALLRHHPRSIAKNFVMAEWQQHKGVYEGNKSAFARDYVRRVLNEYDLVITEKQLREVWLQNNPPAQNG